MKYRTKYIIAGLIGGVIGAVGVPLIYYVYFINFMM